MCPVQEHVCQRTCQRDYLRRRKLAKMPCPCWNAINAPAAYIPTVIPLTCVYARFHTMPSWMILKTRPRGVTLGLLGTSPGSARSSYLGSVGGAAHAALLARGGSARHLPTTTVTGGGNGGSALVGAGTCNGVAGGYDRGGTASGTASPSPSPLRLGGSTRGGGAGRQPVRVSSLLRRGGSTRNESPASEARDASPGPQGRSGVGLSLLRRGGSGRDVSGSSPGDSPVVGAQGGGASSRLGAGAGPSFFLRRGGSGRDMTGSVAASSAAGSASVSASGGAVPAAEDGAALGGGVANGLIKLWSRLSSLKRAEPSGPASASYHRHPPSGLQSPAQLHSATAGAATAAASVDGDYHYAAEARGACGAEGFEAGDGDDGDPDEDTLGLLGPFADRATGGIGAGIGGGDVFAGGANGIGGAALPDILMLSAGGTEGGGGGGGGGVSLSGLLPPAGDLAAASTAASAAGARRTTPGGGGGSRSHMSASLALLDEQPEGGPGPGTLSGAGALATLDGGSTMDGGGGVTAYRQMPRPSDPSSSRQRPSRRSPSSSRLGCVSVANGGAAAVSGAAGGLLVGAAGPFISMLDDRPTGASMDEAIWAAASPRASASATGGLTSTAATLLANETAFAAAAAAAAVASGSGPAGAPPPPLSLAAVAEAEAEARAEVLLTSPSSDRRSPAWMVKRISQAKQDRMVGEVSAWLREALHFNRGGVGGGGSGVHSSTAPAGHLPSGSPAGGGIAARLTHYPYHRASENLPPASPAGSGFGTPPRAVDVLGAYRRGTSCYGVGGGAYGSSYGSSYGLAAGSVGYGSTTAAVVGSTDIDPAYALGGGGLRRAAVASRPKYRDQEGYRPYGEGGEDVWAAAGSGDVAFAEVCGYRHSAPGRRLAG